MPIVLNTNASATEATFNLSKANDNLRKSIARLSSGNRITKPTDDAGGMAVAYKLQSSVKRTEAALNNHQNALSFLQVQDGVLEAIGDIVDRMAELRTMAADITKNSSDIENYSKEFRELQSQLLKMSKEKFNGISIFAMNGSVTGGSTGLNSDAAAQYSGKTYTSYSRQLFTHPSGLTSDGSISLNVSNLSMITSLGAITGSGALNFNLLGVSVANGNTQTGGLVNSSGFIEDISNISISQFTAVISKLADARAENGAEQQRIQQSYNLHSTNLVNLEAAHGRIMDVDVALESTRFAKHNVLVQASASMTAQANQLTQVALTLLQ